MKTMTPSCIHPTVVVQKPLLKRARKQAGEHANFHNVALLVGFGLGLSAFGASASGAPSDAADAAQRKDWQAMRAIARKEGRRERAAGRRQHGSALGGALERTRRREGVVEFWSEPETCESLRRDPTFRGCSSRECSHD